MAVFVRSNLVRRGGRLIPPARVEQVAASLRDPATWFLVAEDAGRLIGMASAMPYRTKEGSGVVVPGLCHLDLLFVLPERWGEGIGGAVLDAVVEHARTRGFTRIQLWTHDDNERSHRLYRSRGFTPTGRAKPNDDGSSVGEWARDL